MSIAWRTPLRFSPKSPSPITDAKTSPHLRSEVEQFPEVFECHLISGAYDYLLKFVSRSVLDYQSLIERLFDAQIGIEKYFSDIVIKSPIAGRKPELSNIVGID